MDKTSSTSIAYEELRRRPGGLRPLRACPAAKLPPSSSECGSGPPIEELGSDRQAPWHRGQASSLKGVSHARVISEVLAQQPYCVNSRSSWQDQPIYRRPTYVLQRARLCWLLHRGVTEATWSPSRQFPVIMRTDRRSLSRDVSWPVRAFLMMTADSPRLLLLLTVR